MKWRKISQNLNMIWGFVSAPEFTNPIRYELLNFAHNYIWKTVSGRTPILINWLRHFFMKYWKKHS